MVDEVKFLGLLPDGRLSEFEGEFGALVFELGDTGCWK